MGNVFILCLTFCVSITISFWHRYLCIRRAVIGKVNIFIEMWLFQRMQTSFHPLLRMYNQGSSVFRVWQAWLLLWAPL